MAQGSFASRIFQKYRKNSQDQKGQESEVPRISEFTIMWDKLSKCDILLFKLKVCRRPSAALSGMCHRFCLLVVRSKTDVDVAYRIKQVVFFKLSTNGFKFD